MADFICRCKKHSWKLYFEGFFVLQNESKIFSPFSVCTTKTLPKQWPPFVLIWECALRKRSSGEENNIAKGTTDHCSSVFCSLSLNPLFSYKGSISLSTCEPDLQLKTHGPTLRGKFEPNPNLITGVTSTSISIVMGEGEVYMGRSHSSQRSSISRRQRKARRCWWKDLPGWSRTSCSWGPASGPPYTS